MLLRLKAKKLAILSIAMFMLVAASSAVIPGWQPTARAAYAGGGSSSDQTSPYLGLIDWVDWTQAATPKDRGMLRKSYTNTYDGSLNWDVEDSGSIYARDINGKGGYHVLSKTPIGNSALQTSCEVSNFYVDADRGKPYFDWGLIKGPWLNVHIPGSLGKDGWDNVYARFNKSTHTGMPVGIGRAGGGRVRFDVQCSAQLRKSDGTATNIPIKGLVFADAETMNNPADMFDGPERAFITPARIDQRKPVSWRVLEYHRAAGDSTHTYVSVGPGSLEHGAAQKDDGILWQYSGLRDRLDVNQAANLYVPDRETRAAFQPLTTLYADNADGAYIDMQVQGNLTGKYGNYIAIGVIVGADLGDGPKSYGQAGAIVQPEVTGREMYRGKYLVSDFPQAEVGAGNAPYLGTKGPDLDTQFARDNRGRSRATWNDLIGDDKTYSLSGNQKINDEDAISQPLLVTAQPGTVQQTIACKADPNSRIQTTVSAWLDWNGNGTFESGERNNDVNPYCSRDGHATLTWNVTDNMLPPASDPAAKPSLLRLMITTQPADTFGPNSLVSDGEVEDHAVTLVRPQVQVTKNIVDINGTANQQMSLAGFSFTAAGSGLDVGTAQQTTTGSGTLTWPLSFTGLTAQPRPLDATEAPTSTTSKTLTVTEAEKAGYRWYPGSECTVPEKASWVRQHGADVYAWPTSVPSGTTATDSGFSVPVTPTSILSCQVKNQPYGKISVMPRIDRGELTSGLNPDSNLNFRGTYTCSAPTSGVFTSDQTVTGTWGPLRAGQTWTSDPANDRIALGSSCVIEQTEIHAGSNATTPAPPLSGNKSFMWAENVTYEPSHTVTAKARPIDERIDQVVVANRIERVKTTSVSWKNLDSDNQEISPATFELSSTGSDGTNVTGIVDCTSDPCQGPDKDPKAGNYRVEDVKLGNGYKLTQTVAPAGYELAEAIGPFNISADYIEQGKTVGPVINKRITASLLPHLPMSGGVSAVLFTLIGACGLLMASGAAYSTLRKKRMEKGDN